MAGLQEALPTSMVTPASDLGLGGRRVLSQLVLMLQVSLRDRHHEDRWDP